jgi:hypothetical protein
MKHSNIGPRYDLSPFTTDDKDLLIEASHNWVRTNEPYIINRFKKTNQYRPIFFKWFFGETNKFYFAENYFPFYNHFIFLFFFKTLSKAKSFQGK